jgi:hypothetical protein
LVETLEVPVILVILNAIQPLFFRQPIRLMDYLMFHLLAWQHISSFGLYHSALSIAHDVKLRQLVRDSIIKDSGFLKSIGDAQMMDELEGKILEITKKNSETLQNSKAETLLWTRKEILSF